MLLEKKTVNYTEKKPVTNSLKCGLKLKIATEKNTTAGIYFKDTKKLHTGPQKITTIFFMYFFNAKSEHKSSI